MGHPHTSPVSASATSAHSTSANHDNEESRYSWMVHCATAEGKAKYAYCNNPEPAALQELYGSSHSYLQNLDASNVKVMHLKDWCLGNDSAAAKKVCPDVKAPKVYTGEYAW